MASLQPQSCDKKQSRRFRPSLRMDMTPLVDLGFLLITFFIFTATISGNAVTPLVVPKEGPPTNAAESATLTVLLGREDKVSAYSGFWEDALNQKNITATNYNVTNGIGALIRQKQHQLAAAGKPKSDLLLIIKPTTDASYKNVVDMLDEVTINGVQRYALVAPTTEEVQFMAATHAVNKP